MKSYSIHPNELKNIRSDQWTRFGLVVLVGCILGIVLHEISEHIGKKSAVYLFFRTSVVWVLPVAVLAGLFADLIYERRVRRRVGVGSCWSCGFSLAGLCPDDQVEQTVICKCPECGKLSTITITKDS